MTDQKPDKDIFINKDEALARELIKSLDDLLAAGDWDATLFLKANKKRLEELRSRAQAVLDQMVVSESSSKQTVREVPLGYKMVYISLFQSESNNLIKWQSAIRGLERYSVSRPVYAEEEHVRTLIRNKADPTREAYVVAFVKETDIVKPYLGKKVQDRFGHELVTLREQAIDLRNLIEFIHDGKHYHYSPEQGLVLI